MNAKDAGFLFADLGGHFLKQGLQIPRCGGASFVVASKLLADLVSLQPAGLGIDEDFVNAVGPAHCYSRRHRDSLAHAGIVPPGPCNVQRGGAA